MFNIQEKIRTAVDEVDGVEIDELTEDRAVLESNTVKFHIELDRGTMTFMEMEGWQGEKVPMCKKMMSEMALVYEAKELALNGDGYE
jgi:hypothetical protein